MTEQLPTLEICGPAGQRWQATLRAERTRIGRDPERNEIVLDDPQCLISREAHCTLLREGGVWWAVAGGTNPLYLRAGTTLAPIRGRAPLPDAATLCILGSVAADGAQGFWELTLRDPHSTRPADPNEPTLIYDWAQARLFVLDVRGRRELTELRPQEHRLIRHMAERNRQAGGVPVLCGYAELRAAVWGAEPGRSETEVNHLIYELRRKLEPDPKQPLFLETVRGLGYRLNVRTVGA